MAETNGVWKQRGQSNLRLLLHFIKEDYQCYTCRLNIRKMWQVQCVAGRMSIRKTVKKEAECIEMREKSL